MELVAIIFHPIIAQRLHGKAASDASLLMN
jgi:hypothetical protein